MLEVSVGVGVQRARQCFCAVVSLFGVPGSCLGARRREQSVQGSTEKSRRSSMRRQRINVVWGLSLQLWGLE